MSRFTILLLVLTSFVLGSMSLPAAVMYTAGSGDVTPGNFSVAITVNSDLAPPINYWNNASFNLVWDASVLTLQSTPVNITGSPITELSTGVNGNFNSPLAGQLNFNWAGGDSYQVPNGSTLFIVNFTAIGDVGDSTTLSFASIASIGLTDVNGNNFTPTTPTGINGLIQVVPEPVDYALGVFGMIVLGIAGVRWGMSRRKLRQAVS